MYTWGLQLRTFASRATGLVAFGLLVSSIAMAQPANDSCANPLAAGLGPNGFDSTGATNEATDPPSCAGQFPGNSVWFTFTPLTSNVYTAVTCSSSFDTILGVYSAPTSCGPYTELACNDDNSMICGPGGNSVVTWCAQAGTNYFLMVFGFEGASGPGTLTITNTGTMCTTPTNDSCATAIVLADTASGSEDTTFADAAGDPFVSCGFTNQHSVYFSSTPASTGFATFSTCNSDYDTVVSVYTGTCSGLTEIACNNDASCGGPSVQSSVTWNVTAATTYTIMVTSQLVTAGTLNYRFSVVATEVACRTGNINGGVGPINNTLFANGSAGSVPDRVVNVMFNAPFQLDIVQTPAGGRRYAMYVWVGPPTAGSVRTLPQSVGTICRVTPLNPGPVQPAKIANNTGFPQAGTENWPGPPTQPAPFTLLNLPTGIGRAGTFYFQGIEFDPGAPNGRAGVTNGIVVVSM
jgi:hypothetical protein